MFRKYSCKFVEKPMKPFFPGRGKSSSSVRPAWHSQSEWGEAGRVSERGWSQQLGPALQADPGPHSPCVPSGTSLASLCT